MKIVMSKSIKQRKWAGLLLVLIVFWIACIPWELYAQDKMPKGNSKGIKWSTLKRVVVKVELENGETIELPVVWRPWSRGPIAYKYEVELYDGKKIQLWVFPKSLPDKWKFWCHGVCFNFNIYSPGGVEVPKILKAGWDEIDCEKMKKGHIMVWYNADGSVAHSAVSNGDGTFTSKNGPQPLSKNATKAELDKAYPNTTAKCYREKKPPKK